MPRTKMSKEYVMSSFLGVMKNSEISRVKFREDITKEEKQSLLIHLALTIFNWQITRESNPGLNGDIFPQTPPFYSFKKTLEGLCVLLNFSVEKLDIKF